MAANRSRYHALAVLLAALLALAVNAQTPTGNGYSTSTSSDAGSNVTSGSMIFVSSAPLL